jgi:hypothetical protein
MELYVNHNWTDCYANTYIAEAIAWTENGNHASIYTVGGSAEEADAKLMGALRELKLMPGTLMKGERDRKESPAQPVASLLLA